VPIMVVRIRWNKVSISAPANEFRNRSSLRLEKFALLAAALLTPSALVAFTLAFWSVASDLHWTGDFFLTHGLFSHWQVWICTAGVLLFLARLLERYAPENEDYSFDDKRSIRS
jgi:hypothetical protein